MSNVLWRDIYGLYSEGWGERMVPEAMAHPAKVRPAVARAIFEHALKMGWWHTGGEVVVTKELLESLRKEVDSGLYQ